MTEHGFIRCELDPCVYYKQLPNGKFVILFLFVDDMLVARTSVRIVHELKKISYHICNEGFRGNEENSWDDYFSG